MSEDVLSCGIAFNYHDSSVSFGINEKIVLVLEAERIFREKKKACSLEEMEYLVRRGLTLLGRKISDVTYWTMTTFNNPCLEPSDVVDEEKNVIKDPYWKKVFLFGSERNVFIVNHHCAHAGVYFATVLDNALIVSCDGGGDIDPLTHTNECFAVYRGKGTALTKLQLPQGSFITGKTYGICSTLAYGNELHDKNPSEGKLMALAGCGKVRNDYYEILAQNFEKIEAADYAVVMDVARKLFPELQGQAKVPTDQSADFAATVHKFFIDRRLEDLHRIVESLAAGEEGLIFAGGASLNIDFNTKAAEHYPSFKHFVAPCCDDTGQSLGAVCILIAEVFHVRPIVDFPYLGEGEAEIRYTKETIEAAVDILLNDGILILHNGKAEIGPRALGNRSFIARPDKLEVKNKLSEGIKKRESYRPVAPVVAEDEVGEYFLGPDSSPFMLYRYEVKEQWREKMIGAVHVDKSARVQTVTHSSNPFLYDLIKAFKAKTGVPVLLNTSLNFKGQPLANKIEESMDIYEKIDGPKGIVHDGVLLKKA